MHWSSRGSARLFGTSQIGKTERGVQGKQRVEKKERRERKWRVLGWVFGSDERGFLAALRKGEG